MPAGLPNAPEVVPVSIGGQVVNLTPSDAAAAFAGATFTPTRDFAITMPSGQIVQFRKGVPVQTDPAMVARLDAISLLTVGTTIPAQAATEAVAFSFQFAADAFADPDEGSVITYTATKGDNTALPAWLTFTAATRTFSGTPAGGDVGTLTVKVTATSGNGQAVFQTFDIVVAGA